MANRSSQARIWLLNFQLASLAPVYTGMEIMVDLCSLNPNESQYKTQTHGDRFLLADQFDRAPNNDRLPIPYTVPDNMICDRLPVPNTILDNNNNNYDMRNQ